MMKYPLGQHRARALLRRLGITLALLAPACAGEPSGLQPPPPALSVLSGTATFPGARVRTLDIANIRATASIGGALLGTQPKGATGTVLAGPVVDVNGDKLTRWQIDFDTGADGWAADLYLDQTSSGPAVGAVTVSPSPAGVIIGQTTQLAAVVKDTAGAVMANPAVSWSSSNATVATVTSGGQVK